MARKSAEDHRLRLADDLYAAIAKEAARERLSVTWIIDRLLRERFLPTSLPKKGKAPV